MNNIENEVMKLPLEIKTKSSSATITTTPIRVKRATRRRILSELARINKKDQGRKVTTDELISLALDLVGPTHVRKLQDSTLSNSDRLEASFREYVKGHGSITKDEYLGKLRKGEL